MRTILILLILFSGNAFADNAQTLYESACIECHSHMTGGDGSVLYKRDDSIVTSPSTLFERVSYCADGASVAWGDAEVEAVTDYLNDNYYHF